MAFLDPDNRANTLPAESKIHMPLWAVEKWALMNYVTISLPKKHYGARARERLAAEPTQVNLRYVLQPPDPEERRERETDQAERLLP